MDGKLDIFSYTNIGGEIINADVLKSEFWNGCFNAVLCDGFKKHMETAALCSETAIKMMRETNDINEILNYIYHHRKPGGYSTICITKIENDLCKWGNIGDSRLYHFSKGIIADKSIDNSKAYQQYMEGKINYEDIRMANERSELTEYIGNSNKIVEINTDEFILKEEDGLLLCSDGFWQYIYEYEMEIDFCKSIYSNEWAENMLIRIAKRSLFCGDNLTLAAVIFKPDKREINL